MNVFLFIAFILFICLHACAQIGSLDYIKRGKVYDKKMVDRHECDKAIAFGTFDTIFTAGGISCLVISTIEMSIYNTQKCKLGLALLPG